MKLIEKECPNCGAGLEFDENAKSCKCDYCKRSYGIEKEKSDNTSLVNYKLTELPLFMKIFGTYFLGSWIISSIIMGVVGLLIFIFIAVVIFKDVLGW